MVYSLDILNSDLTNNLVTIQNNAAPKKVVTVFFDGKAVHDVTGPTPFIDLSTAIERNEAGEPTVVNNKITLSGKIAKSFKENTPSISGIEAVMSGVSGLKGIFSTNSCGSFEVKCNDKPIFSAAGVRVVSIDASKSSDNWVFTADYTVILEYLEPAYSGWYVKQYSDSWNIEPLEEYLYTNDKINVTQKQEYHNPNLKPTAASQSSLQPGNSQSQNSNGTPSSASIDVQYINIPQYKVSRSISAVGIPSGTGFCGSVPTTIDVDKYPALAMSAFMNAKNWVEQRSSSVFLSSRGSQANPQAIWSPLNEGYFYNHLRSVNFDIHSAKYEITDTWLAMPTGITFIEDYSIEMSTDDKYIHTVRIQGDIRGLAISSPVLTGKPIVSGSGSPVRLDLSSSKDLISNGSMPHAITDNGLASAVSTISSSRYTNALSGWLYDVKPYLYRRASIGMNSKDRDRTYVSPTTNPPQAPGNPIYCSHNLLNIIPISTSESHNPKKGTVSYSYEFNNKFTIISGVLYESISMEDTGPTDVIGEVMVLGRSLGPILQNLGTKTSTKKSITIEIGVVPPTSLAGFFITNNACPLWTGGTVYKTISGIIEGFKPFGDRDSSIFGTNVGRSNIRGQVYLAGDGQTWDPTNGRYVRNVSWIYQQCSNDKNYLDH